MTRKNGLSLTLGTILFFAFVSWANCTTYYADPSAADQGAAGGQTIKSLAVAIGTNRQATIILQHNGSGTASYYTVGQNLDLSTYTNITFKFERGAILSHGIHKISIPHVDAGLYRIFNGTGAVALPGIKYPEWFGARGNNAADDTAALQATLNTGGIIKLSDKIYRFTFLTLPATGTTLEGNGWSSVLSTTAPAMGNTSPVIWIKANNVTLKSIKVAWAAMPSALQAFNPINNNSTVSVGWSEVTGSATLIENAVIDHIYVSGGKQHGIAIGRSKNVTVVNSTIAFPYGTGIWAYYSNNIKVQNNRIEETGDDGIYVAANGADSYGPDDYSVNPLISGNTILNSGAKGIGVGGTYGASIVNNTIDGTWASAIVAKSDYAGGHVKPIMTNISGNIIRRVFQNYGTGKYRRQHIVAATAGVYGIIECHSDGRSTVNDNTIEDRSALHSHYRALWLSSQILNVKGNKIITDGNVAVVIGNDSPKDTTNVDYFVMSGNTVDISPGNGYQMLSLFGVASGLVTGNYFNCGGQGASSPKGRFLVTHWATNVEFKNNVIINYTDKQANSGHSSGIIFDVGTAP